MGQEKFDTFNSLGSAQFKINVLKDNYKEEKIKAVAEITE